MSSAVAAIPESPPTGGALAYVARSAESAAGREPGTLRRFGLRWLAAWIVLGARHVVLFMLVPGTAWSDDRLTTLTRCALLAQGVLAAGVRAVLIAWLLGIVADSPRASRWSIAARATAAVMLLTIETLMLASWATFYALGEFLDRESSAFFLSNAALVIAHARDVAPVSFVAVPVTAAAVVWACSALGRALNRLTRRRGRAVVRAGVGTLLAVGALASIGHAFAISDIDSESRIALSRETNDRTAPMLHLGADLLAAATGHAETVAARPGESADIDFENRPILSIAEYAHRAHLARAHHWNVLVVIFESLRADQVRAFGSTRRVLPTVDAIASEGTAYAAAQTEATVTNLSVPATLASQYPLRDLTDDPYADPLPYPRVLLYDALKAAGYHTGFFSSQNEGWGGMINFMRSDGLDHFLDSEHFNGPTYVPRGDRGFAFWVRGDRHAGKIDDRFTAAETVAWLDSVPHDHPFFAYLNLQSGHLPYERPADFAPRFGSGQASFPITFAGFPRDSVAVVRDLYANSLAYADAQLGTVVAALHASHRWDSTLVVILGDHGEAFYEHDLPAHGNALFQELTRVPLVVRVPGQTARVDSLPAASIDVPPTVLGALGLPPHPAFQGIDLGDSVGRRHRPEFLLVKTPMRHAAGIVQDGAKLIVDTRTGDATMYDLRRDPGEHHPLDPAWTARGRALNASLTAWWNAQLAYYASPSAKRHFYAPAIVPAAHDRPLPTPSSSGVVRQPVARAASG